MTKGKERIQLSFTIFAMFFGAGNLIFPVFLAYSAGSNIITSFAGFVLSAIGFPVLALLAIERSGSLEEIGKRVHPFFSRIFTLVIYLSIGPCLAIPRTASTSFEMVSSAFSLDGLSYSIAYSMVFFLLAAIIAQHPERLTKSLGRILAPALLILIAILFIGSVGEETITHQGMTAYASSPFSQGFRDGYQTMDAIAGLVFGSVLALNLKALGKKGNEIRKEGIIASIGGGLLLLIVYSSLAFIGMKAAAFVVNPSTGADILSASASLISKEYGRILLAAIFIIACFNTSVGLLSSCGEYFSMTFPGLSRRTWILIFALVSALIANIGLEAIISLSVPVLELIYPAAISLIILSFVPESNEKRAMNTLGTSASLISSLLSMLGIPMPLSAAGFGWLLPTAVFAAIGYAIDSRKLRNE